MAFKLANMTFWVEAQVSVVYKCRMLCTSGHMKETKSPEINKTYIPCSCILLHL